MEGLPSRRRPGVRWAALVLCLLVPLLARTATGPLPIPRGTVTAVYDGDTIRVEFPGRRAEKVRLIGVDSPELDDAREAVRFLAFLAKRFAFRTLYRQHVDLLPGPQERDVYGRLLAYVILPDGRPFNELIVGEGFAHAALRFPFDARWKARLEEAERSARRLGKGLWRKEPYPVVEAVEAMRFTGEVLSVRFYCRRLVKRSGWIVLEAEARDFEARVPISVFRALPGRLDLEGTELVVTGLVELEKGRARIVIGLPSQLKRSPGQRDARTGADDPFDRGRAIDYKSPCSGVWSMEPTCPDR